MRITIIGKLFSFDLVSTARAIMNLVFWEFHFDSNLPGLGMLLGKFEVTRNLEWLVIHLLTMTIMLVCQMFRLE